MRFQVNVFNSNYKLGKPLCTFLLGCIHMHRRIKQAMRGLKDTQSISQNNSDRLKSLNHHTFTHLIFCIG